MSVRRIAQRLPARPLPKRGYGIRPGTNPPIATPYATPVFAARHADAHWTIFDWATGETVGAAGDFQ